MRVFILTSRRELRYWNFFYDDAPWTSPPPLLIDKHLARLAPSQPRDTKHRNPERDFYQLSLLNSFIEQKFSFLAGSIALGISRYKKREIFTPVKLLVPLMKKNFPPSIPPTEFSRYSR